MVPIVLNDFNSPTTNIKTKVNLHCSGIKSMIGRPKKNPAKLIVDTTEIDDSAG